MKVCFGKDWDSGSSGIQSEFRLGMTGAGAIVSAILCSSKSVRSSTFLFFACDLVTRCDPP